MSIPTSRYGCLFTIRKTGAGFTQSALTVSGIPYHNRAKCCASATINPRFMIFSKFLPIFLEPVKGLKTLLGARFELCHKEARLGNR